MNRITNGKLAAFVPIALAAVVLTAHCAEAQIQRRAFGRPPVIGQHPVSAILPEDSFVVLRVEPLQSATPLTYQWFKDGKPLGDAPPPPPPPPPQGGGGAPPPPPSNGEESELRFTSVKPQDAGEYRVTVTNSAGSVDSSPAFLTIVTPPSARKTAFVGTEVFLELEFSGSDEYEIVWKFNDDDIPEKVQEESILKKDSHVSRLRIPNVELSDEGVYEVEIEGSDAVSESFFVELGFSIPEIQRVQDVVEVSTFAGESDGFADGTAELARFNDPNSLTVDLQGNLYVGDERNVRIRKIDIDGSVSTLTGSGRSGFRDGSASEAEFHDPPTDSAALGVAVDSNGNVYVADTFNHAIRKVDPNGTVSTLAGAGFRGFRDGSGQNAEFWKPSSLAVDTVGNLYVTDTLNNAIRMVTSEGIVTTLVGGEPGDNDGLISEARLREPAGIAIDEIGNLWVTEFEGHRIRKIGIDGIVTTVAGNGEAGYVDGQVDQARFSFPSGIAVTSTGDLYITEPGTHVIRRITTAGFVETVAGSIFEGFQNGTGDQAMFRGPLGIAVRNDGSIFVTDSSNHRVRQIEILRSTLPPSLSISSDGSTLQISIEVAGEVGQIVELQSSADLINWNMVETVTLIDGSANVFGEVDSNQGQRFFRAISP